MKYYIIHITYVVPLETVVEHTPNHRAHLKNYYDKGILLFSGPRVPRTGGILFARSEELSVIEEMVSTDPFKTTGTADYEIIEINPVMWAELLNNVFG